MSLTEKMIRMSISDAKEVVRMVKAEVTRANHQRLIDSIESESSVALLVHIRHGHESGTKLLTGDLEQWKISKAYSGCYMYSIVY